MPSASYDYSLASGIAFDKPAANSHDRVALREGPDLQEEGHRAIKRGPGDISKRPEAFILPTLGSEIGDLLADDVGLGTPRWDVQRPQCVVHARVTHTHTPQLRLFQTMAMIEVIGSYQLGREFQLQQLSVTRTRKGLTWLHTRAPICSQA